MSEDKLHPDVEAFKRFVEKNPQIIREARSGKRDLNYYFKHFQKYGKTDSLWAQFGVTNDDNTIGAKDKKDGKKKWTDHIKGFLDKVEFENLDQHVKQADSAIGEIKKLVTHFSELKGDQQPQSPTPPQRPQPPMSNMNRRFF